MDCNGKPGNLCVASSSKRFVSSPTTAHGLYHYLSLCFWFSFGAFVDLDVVFSAVRVSHTPFLLSIVLLALSNSGLQVHGSTHGIHWQIPILHFISDTLNFLLLFITYISSTPGPPTSLSETSMKTMRACRLRRPDIHIPTCPAHKHPILTPRPSTSHRFLKAAPDLPCTLALLSLRVHRALAPVILPEHPCCLCLCAPNSHFHASPAATTSIFLICIHNHAHLAL